MPQGTIQNINAPISVLNGALWDMGQVYLAICEVILITMVYTALQKFGITWSTRGMLE